MSSLDWVARFCRFYLVRGGPLPNLNIPICRGHPQANTTGIIGGINRLGFRSNYWTFSKARRMVASLYSDILFATRYSRQAFTGYAVTIAIESVPVADRATGSFIEVLGFGPCGEVPQCLSGPLGSYSTGFPVRFPIGFPIVTVVLVGVGAARVGVGERVAVGVRVPVSVS
jgi:hypothetical protein